MRLLQFVALASISTCVSAEIARAVERVDGEAFDVVHRDVDAANVRTEDAAVQPRSFMTRFLEVLSLKRSSAESDQVYPNQPKAAPGKAQHSPPKNNNHPAQPSKPTGKGSGQGTGMGNGNMNGNGHPSGDGNSNMNGHPSGSGNGNMNNNGHPSGNGNGDMHGGQPSKPNGNNNGNGMGSGNMNGHGNGNGQSTKPKPQQGSPQTHPGQAQPHSSGKPQNEQPGKGQPHTAPMSHPTGHPNNGQQGGSPLKGSHPTPSPKPSKPMNGQSGGNKPGNNYPGGNNNNKNNNHGKPGIMHPAPDSTNYPRMRIMNRLSEDAKEPEGKSPAGMGNAKGKMPKGKQHEQHGQHAKDGNTGLNYHPKDGNTGGNAKGGGSADSHKKPGSNHHGGNMAGGKHPANQNGGYSGMNQHKGSSHPNKGHSKPKHPGKHQPEHHKQKPHHKPMSTHVPHVGHPPLSSTTTSMPALPLHQDQHNAVKEAAVNLNVRPVGDPGSCVATVTSTVTLAPGTTTELSYRHADTNDYHDNKFLFFFELDDDHERPSDLHHFSASIGLYGD